MSRRVLHWSVATAGVVALIVSRRPDRILSPQFWAEDGAVGYRQAYELGPLAALWFPAGGYLNMFSRLVAAVSLAFDLRDAPLVFNVAAVLVQSLPPLLLLSDRFAAAIPDLRIRILAALLLIGAPNGFEIQSNITNAHTHLAMLSLLIVLAEPPRTGAGKAFDVFFLVLGGLSGPTCVLLVPVATLAWWYRSRAWSGVLVALLLVLAGVQLATYWSSAGPPRIGTPLGASTSTLLRILGGQIFFAGTLGARGYVALRRLGEPWLSGTTLLLGVGGILFMARALWVSRSFTLAMLTLFTTLALAASLASPALVAQPRWTGLLNPYAGSRYWALPILAYLAVLLWTACRAPSARFRYLGRVLLACVLLVGMPLDWRVFAERDLDFAGHAARFAAAAPGEVVRIPIPPAGWFMVLRKHDGEP